MDNVQVEIDDGDVFGPLSPNCLFNSLVHYKIIGRGTDNPVAVIDDASGIDSSQQVFSITDVRFEIAKRDFVGQSALFASIVLADLVKNRS